MPIEVFFNFSFFEHLNGVHTKKKYMDIQIEHNLTGFNSQTLKNNNE